MSVRVIAFLLPLAILIASFSPTTRAVPPGCAIAWQPGDDVAISEEAALIVWDAEQGTEHFIRKANFVTAAENFGFLVPTPSVPTLHEAGDHIFSFLGSLTEPRTEWVETVEERFRLFKPGTGFDFFLPMDPLTNSVDAMATPAGVEVIDQLSVAGYDAAILKGDDASAIQQWLGENGYQTRDSLTEWLEKYAQEGWYITAFKFSATTLEQRSDSPEIGPGAASPVIARPVRLTFKTATPFYPYREPVDARQDSATGQARMLRLFVLADQRISAGIGLGGSDPTQTVWAGRLQSYQIDNLRRYAGADRPQEQAPLPELSDDVMYLTELEDPSSPRQGTDELYLQPAADQTDVERPTIKQSVIRVQYSPDLWKWPFWTLAGLLGVYQVRRLASRK